MTNEKKKPKIDTKCLTRKCEQCKNYIYCFRDKQKKKRGEGKCQEVDQKHIQKMK